MMPLQVATLGGERGELASGAGGRRGGSEVGCGGGVLVGTATCGVEAVAGEEGHCASIESADGEETTRVLSSIEFVLELRGEIEYREKVRADPTWAAYLSSCLKAVAWRIEKECGRTISARRKAFTAWALARGAATVSGLSRLRRAKATYMKRKADVDKVVQMGRWGRCKMAKLYAGLPVMCHDGRV
jgi:hypothetical protein